MVGKPVDHRGSHLIISKDRPPLGELKIGRENNASALIGICNYPEQELSSLPVDENIAPFVNDQEISPCDVLYKPLKRSFLEGFGKLYHEFCRGKELGTEGAKARGNAKGSSKMCLPGSYGATPLLLLRGQPLP